MQQEPQYAEFRDWQRPVGRWATEATHPVFPGTVVSGESIFEGLEDQRCLIRRSRCRGVHRVFEVDITSPTWRFWNAAPGFSLRVTHNFSDDGNVITGQAELSRDDGATWEDDVAITYRRVG